jgi:hypothetical protein
MKIAQQCSGLNSPKQLDSWQLLLLTLLLSVGTTRSYGQDPASRDSELGSGSAAQRSEIAPSFDVAYVDETGKLVAAGRGKAGWIIQLKSGAQMLGETTADKRNEWVMTPQASLPPGDYVLSLSEIDPVSKRGIAGKGGIALSIRARQVGRPEQPRKVTRNKN